MAVTAARVLQGGLGYRISGNQKRTVSDITFDSSYPTGGEPVTAANLGLTHVHTATCDIKAVGGTVNVTNVFYDDANKKLKAFDETPAEVAAASDLSTLVVRVTAHGT